MPAEGSPDMNANPTVTDIETITAPWGKQVTLQTTAYEGGVRFIRMRIKEGSRFTDLELDPDTASRIGRTLFAWVHMHRQDRTPGA
jgi:hypothetical protein